MSRSTARRATAAHNASTGGKTWRDRVEAVDWSAVRAGLDRYGCALTGPLLTPGGGGRDHGALP